MAKKIISDGVREEVCKIVDEFNKNTIQDPAYFYAPRFRGAYLYLDRAGFQSFFGKSKPSPICRLKFNSGTANWDFAIYKYSDNGYDSDEWFFPGSEHVDGTVEGAMKAGLEAYP